MTRGTGPREIDETSLIGPTSFGFPDFSREDPTVFASSPPPQPAFCNSECSIRGAPRVKCRRLHCSQTNQIYELSPPSLVSVGPLSGSVVPGLAAGPLVSTKLIEFPRQSPTELPTSSPPPSSERIKRRRSANLLLLPKPCIIKYLFPTCSRFLRQEPTQFQIQISRSRNYFGQFYTEARKTLNGEFISTINRVGVDHFNLAAFSFVILDVQIMLVNWKATLYNPQRIKLVGKYKLFSLLKVECRNNC